MANKYTDAVHAMVLPGTSKNRVTLKAILMAWHTDNKAGTFWGSHTRSAYEANCSRQAVKENVPKAIELGLLEIIGEKPTRNGRCNVYRMNLNALLKLSDRGVEQPSRSATGLDSVSDQVVEHSHQGAVQCDQVAVHPKNSSLNSSGTRQVNSSKVARASSLRSPDHEQHQGQHQHQPRREWTQIEKDDSPSVPVHPAPQAHTPPVPPPPRSW
jgi:hypothetical protein